MEQYFQDNHFYFQAGDPPDSGPACDTDTTTSVYFDFSCPTDTLTATAYTLTATGKSSMTGFHYTVTRPTTEDQPLHRYAPQAGQRTAPNCWVTSKGGGC
jgi:type IV pilus assembly protein PilE